MLSHKYLVVALWIAAMASWLAALGLLVACARISGDSLRVDLLALAAMGCGGLGFAASGYAEALSESIRLRENQEAARSDARPFLLLLRSLQNVSAYGTRPVSIHVPGEPTVLVSHDFLTADNVVSQLERSLRRQARLVALGRTLLLDPGHEALIVESTEQRWRDDVLLLAGPARALLLLPERTAGVLEEMALIRECGLLDKTLVIMPRLAHRGVETKGQEPRDWEALRARLTDNGYRLPAASDRGLMYLPNPDFSVRESVDLAAGFEAALATLLPKLAGGVFELRSVYSLLSPRLSRRSFGFRETFAHVDEVSGLGALGGLVFALLWLCVVAFKHC